MDSDPEKSGSIEHDRRTCQVNSPWLGVRILGPRTASRTLRYQPTRPTPAWSVKDSCFEDQRITQGSQQADQSMRRSRRGCFSMTIKPITIGTFVWHFPTVCSCCVYSIWTLYLAKVSSTHSRLSLRSHHSTKRPKNMLSQQSRRVPWLWTALLMRGSTCSLTLCKPMYIRSISTTSSLTQRKKKGENEDEEKDSSTSCLTKSLKATGTISGILHAHRDLGQFYKVRDDALEPGSRGAARGNKGSREIRGACH
ncbi:hypothetical protein BC939DRAFT_440184 [Gamsiella multidivaricata]|uniref:uncharacterized protein n=1 Tax=Gamsiella multidivaricata TaxID=101098 RepID=UPI00221E77CD|nr:uncharacterized protein BC939DRAFT_440184 [Gamsiella multidivaricata]KAI7830317.1 hypothetical protein BC939DRAFT_440184 [Gamsiella multidivaricata]